MKKLLLSLVCLFALVALVACGNNEQEKTPAEAEYKLGMGVVAGIGHASSAKTIQIDSTVAAVVLDKDGKIVACRIDALQNKATVNDGVLTSSNVTSKAELKEAYNMAAHGTSQIGNEKVLEWYLQAQAFEAHVVGMTSEDVANMPVQTIEASGYVISNDQALLDAGCTIQITEFKDAVVAACNDDQAATFKTSKEFKLGVAVNGELESGSKAATEAVEGTANLYSEYAATVVVDGKVAASLNDAIQPKLNFTFAGVATTVQYKNTKRVLKEGYNMAAYGESQIGNEVVLEWYIQSAAFSAHIVGMTSEDVANMPVQTIEASGYVISNDQALLDAGCTIQITGMKAVVVDSITNAR